MAHGPRTCGQEGPRSQLGLERPNGGLRCVHFWESTVARPLPGTHPVPLGSASLTSILYT